MNVKHQPISEYYVNDIPNVHINNKYPSQHNHLLLPRSQKSLNYKNRELIFYQLSKILNSESNQKHNAEINDKKVFKVKRKESTSSKKYGISKSVETQKYANKLANANSKVINAENSGKRRIRLKSISKYPYFHSEFSHEKKILFVLQSPQESSECITYMQTFKNCSNKRIITIRAMEEYFYFKYDEREGENYLILGPLVAAKELARFKGIDRVFVFGGNAKAITKLISENVCRAALIAKEMDDILKEEGFDKNTPNIYFLPHRITKSLKPEEKTQEIDLPKDFIETKLSVPPLQPESKTKALTNQSSTDHHSEYLTRSNPKGLYLKGYSGNNSEKESITNLLKIGTKKSIINSQQSSTSKKSKIKESKVILSASEPDLQMSHASSDNINLGISSMIRHFPHESSNNMKTYMNQELANESVKKGSNSPKSPGNNNMDNASIPSLPLSKSTSKKSIKRNFYGFRNLEQKLKTPSIQSQNSLRSSIYKNDNHTESIIIFQQATPSSGN